MSGLNTGLRLENTTSNTITLDLLEQGADTGSSTLKKTTQASNGFEEYEGQPTDAGSRLFYYDGDLTFNEDSYINVDIDDVYLQTNVTNGRVVFSDDSNGVDNINGVYNFAFIRKLITDNWEQKNLVSASNRLKIELQIQIKANSDPTLLDMRFKWDINYLIPTDEITFLIKSIFFNDDGPALA